MNSARNPYSGVVDPILMSKMHQTLNATLMSRQEMLSQFMDPRRDIDDECGFPSIDSLPPTNTYKSLYDREAIAARVVELYPLESWQVTPEVYEDEDSENVTEFEQAWDDLAKGLTMGGGKSWFNDEEGSPVWEYLLRADILSGIGHFGVILLGIDDGRALHEPVDGVMSLEPPTDQRKYLRNGWVMNRSVPEGEPLDDRTQRMSTLVDNAGNWNPLSPPPVAGDKPKPPGGPPGQLPPRPAAPPAPAAPPVPGRHDLSMQDPPTSQHPAAPKLPGSIGAMPPRASNPPINPAGSPEPKKDPGMPEGSAGARTVQPGFSMPMETDKGPQPAGLSGTDAQYVGVQFGPPEYPSEKPSGEKRNLIYLRVFDESLVQITQYEANVSNPRFGQPIMYRITLNDPREQHSGVGLPLATVMVHWSRVIHIADQRRSSEIFGTPRMRQVLNHILSLRKVYGGDGESYWRNCVMKLFFETHPQLGGDVEIDNAGMQDMMENMMNGLQQWGTLKGMSAKPIAPAVVDPTAHVNVQIEAICIKLGCPKRVFMGSERGELASSQDDSAWNDRLRHRQRFYNTPRIIVPFIDRLIQIGVLPEPKAQNQTGAAGPGQDEPFILHPSPTAAPPAGPGGPKPPGAPGMKPPGMGGPPGAGGPGGGAGGPPGAGVAGQFAPKSAPKPLGPPSMGGGAMGGGAAGGFGGAPKPSFGAPGEAPGAAAGMPPAGGAPAPKPPKQFNPLSNRLTLKIHASGLVVNADTGKPVTEEEIGQADPNQVVLEAEAGYRVRWPDLDSLSDKDKAGVLLQRTQAMGAYIQGGIEAMMPPHDWLTREAGFDEDEATEILQQVEDASAAKEQQAMDQQSTQMAMADQQMQQDLSHQDAIMKQGMDHQEEAIDRGIAPDPTDPKQMMPHAIAASGPASSAAGQAAGGIHGAAHGAETAPAGAPGGPNAKAIPPGGKAPVGPAGEPGPLSGGGNAGAGGGPPQGPAGANPVGKPPRPAAPGLPPGAAPLGK